MKIQPIAAPQGNATSSTPTLDPGMKARAVAAFNAAQVIPPVNPNSVSAEELGAIQAQSSENTDKSTEESVDAPEVPAEAPAKPAEDPAVSRQFAQLARQEKALRAKVQQQEQAIKAREQALQAREAALASKDQEYQTGYISRDRLKSDPLGVMAETGLTYEELTQQILTQQPKDPRVEATISRLEAKIKALEDGAQNTQKSYQEQQQNAYQAAVRQIETDARALVKQDPNFETIRATGAVKDVVELITQTYDKDGVLLTVEEAAQQVEDYLVEEAMKITRIDKIKNRIAANASQASTKAQTPATNKQPQMKTLTNATGSSRELSAKERAILAFKGQLNK